MWVYQSKMEFHLFLRQWSLHISDAQRLREQFRMIQLLDILMEMNDTFHLAWFLIIGQRIHRLHLDRYIPVLYTSAVITLIFLILLRVISNHNLPVIVHILIGLLTRLALILTILSIIIRDILIICCNSVTFVNLHLHEFEFILFSPLTITDLLTSFSTMIISCHKVGVFINHFRIITDCPTIISSLCTQQTTVEGCHHIIRLYLQDEIKVFYCTVIITHLSTEQTTVIVSEEVIRINIQCQIIITHGTSQIILMKTSQCTINIITCILCTQMNRMIQVSFSIRILSLLQTDNSACSPPVRIIAIHFNRLFKIIQGLYRIFLLQWYFTTHQISTSISGRYFQ